jgi:hypothetical protein
MGTVCSCTLPALAPAKQENSCYFTREAARVAEEPTP